MKRPGDSQPWYWWGYPVLDMHWYWNQQRSLLGDNWWPSFLLRLAGILAVVGGTMAVAKRLLYRLKGRGSEKVVRWVGWFEG